MVSEKLKVLDKVNEKIANFQNKLKIQLLYANGDKSAFDILKDENIWVQDEEFGVGSRYKTLRQFNKTDVNLSPVLFEGKEGNIVHTHTHNESHLFICLNGKIEVTLDECDTYLLEESESIYITSQQPHRFEFMEDSKLIILVLNVK